MMALAVWLGGWAVEPAVAERFLAEVWPGVRHRWVYPGPGWAAELVAATAGEEGPIFRHGYSLGAALLLRYGWPGGDGGRRATSEAASEPSLGPASGGAPEGAEGGKAASLTLWAPFRSLVEGVSPEGRVAAVELGRLRVALEGNPAATVAAFYRVHRLGLPVPGRRWLEGHQKELAWGLDWLAGLPEAVARMHGTWPEAEGGGLVEGGSVAGWSCHWGERDRLVDGWAAKRAWGGISGHVYPEAGHGLPELLKASGMAGGACQPGRGG